MRSSASASRASTVTVGWRSARSTLRCSCDAHRSRGSDPIGTARLSLSSDGSAQSDEHRMRADRLLRQQNAPHVTPCGDSWRSLAPKSPTPNRNSRPQRPPTGAPPAWMAARATRVLQSRESESATRTRPDASFSSRASVSAAGAQTLAQSAKHKCAGVRLRSSSMTRLRTRQLCRRQV